MTKLKKSSIGVLAVLMSVCLTSSTVVYAFNDDNKSAAYTSASNAYINKVNASVDMRTQDFFDSKTVYRLPETVKSDDDVSIIVAMSTPTVTEAYGDSSYGGKVGEFASTAEGKLAAEKVSSEADKLIKKLDGSGLKYTIGNRYDTVVSGFEVTIKARDYEKLGGLLGDEATLIVGEEYERCETQIVTNDVDVYETGIFDSSSSRYQGDGVVVAVLDTGLDYTHSAFDVKNFSTSNEALTLDGVSAKIGLTTAAKYTANLTGSDVYVSRKVPYAYDYADKDADVFPINSEHGTHVAGIIAGNDDVITGVAPNAQLAIMKVFSDTTEGAKTSNIIAALEDCVNLGVDVINMSLGSACGFTTEVDKQHVNVIYDRVKEAGISLIASAANQYNATFGSEKNGSNGTTSNPDSGTVGSPSTYEAALSIASVDGVKTPYLKYGEDIIYFNEASTSASKKKNFVDDVLKTVGEDVTSHEFEYVTIPNIGRSSDYIQPKEYYAGKIVLVKRGTTTFEDKVRVALIEKGASGIIIYNNVSGDISMSVGKDIGAVCSISQDEGEKLAANLTGKIVISKGQTAGPFMSDFSSWGPTSDLRIKPEITAHGGEILSAVPGQSYDRLSGTSMAAPNQAGATALIRQYVKYSGTFGELSSADSSKQVTALVNRLMMSTADIVYNKNGLPYAVRKQGAGLVNITKSYTSASYITTYKDGEAMDKTKIELGDDKNRTGVYEMTFDINNVSSSSVSYDIGSLITTEGVSPTYTSHGDTTVTQNGRLLDAQTKVTAVSGGQNSENTVTVSAKSTAKVTVVITLSDADKKYLNDSFAHGMYVEGFITFKAKSGTTVDMNAPLLAFYGDWTEAPIFDEEYYDTHADEINAGIDPEDKLMADAYATRVLGGLYSDYIATLGSYYFVQDPAINQIATTKEHIAISNHEDGEGSSITRIRSISAGMLRNAKEIYLTIVEDSTGNLIYSKTISNQHKSYGNGSSIYGSSIDIEFAALENKLKNNTKYTATIKAYIDYGTPEEQNNVRNTFTFPFYVDYEAPIITDVEYRTEYDRLSKKTKLFADISVYDNHYAMGVQLGQFIPAPADSQYTFAMNTFGKYITPVYSSFNSTSKVTIELTDYIPNIKDSCGLKIDASGNGSIEYNNNTFVANVYDYAMNSATYELRLPDEVLELVFAEEEIKLSPNETFDLASPETGFLKINPISTWSQVLDYKSDAPDIAEVINQTILAKQSGSANITVTGKDAKGNEVSATVKVTVLSPGDEGYTGGYSVPEINKFTLTGYKTNKAYYSVVNSERTIGTAGNNYDFAGDYKLSMYPSESVTLNYSLDSYFPDNTSIEYSVGNSRIATVDDDGTIVAQKEGETIVFLNVKYEGRPTVYSANVVVTVKDPFITQSIYLNSYKGLGGEVIIPDDRGITTIYSYAFSNYEYIEKDTANGDVIDEEDPYFIKQWYIGEDTITKVVIPEGVEEIQAYAFTNLTALEEVVLPASLKKIGVGAFMDCVKLSKINLENVKFINEKAFYGCNLSDVSLNNVVAIGNYTFANCKLNNILLPSSAQSLGIGAFSANQTLTSVDFKASKMKIGSYAFENCIQLMAININAAVISSYAFSGCRMLNKVTLGKDVSVIGEYAFRGCAISSFTVDSRNGIFKTEENGALLFSGSELVLVAPAYEGKTITLTASKIAAGAFAGNKNVVYVYANNATSVGAYAFAECYNLRRVYLDKVEEIGDYAFSKSGLAETPDLSKVKLIGAYAFEKTKITSVEIADGAIVGECAFVNCTDIASVVIGKNVTVGAKAFYMPLNFDWTYENNADIDISNYTDSFYMFYTPFTYTPYGGTESYTYYRYNYYLLGTSSIKSLIVGEGSVIGESAFEDSSKLTSLILGDGVKIGYSAFYNCFSLTDVDISKVEEIGDYAFSGTQTVNFVLNGNGVFAPAYEYSYLNGTREEIDLSISSAAPGLSSVDLTGVKALGTGAFACNSALSQVKLGGEITEIPAYTFAYSSLEQVELPENIKNIGAYAFYRSYLTKADLSGIVNIGAAAFEGSPLTEVVLNAEGCQIGAYAFAGNVCLQTVVNIDKKLIIGEKAFAETAIESVDLSGTVYIGSFAFENSAVKQVKFGSALAALGENPFYNCEIATFSQSGDDRIENVSGTVKIIDGVLYQIVPNGLELISYPADMQQSNYYVEDGTVRISDRAFANSQLRNVTLPKSLDSIGDKAFYGCENLALVVFNGYEAPLLEEAFDSDYMAAENMPGKNGLGIAKYLSMLIRLDNTNYYYGATFVDYIGKTDGKVAMVKPCNGTGYNSFIFAQYFGAVAEGKAAPTDETLAVIALLDKLPDAMAVTLDSEAQIVAARQAYELLTSIEQKSLVDNYSRLTDAESTLEFLKNSQGPDKPHEGDPGENKGSGLVVMILGYIIAGVALAAVAVLVAYIVIQKRKGGNGGEEIYDEEASAAADDTAKEAEEKQENSQLQAVETEDSPTSENSEENK